MDGCYQRHAASDCSGPDVRSSDRDAFEPARLFAEGRVAGAGRGGERLAAQDAQTPAPVLDRAERFEVGHALVDARAADAELARG